MGALTAKDYVHKGRPWEIRSIKSISTNNFYFEEVNVDVRGKSVLRLLPYIGEEFWIKNSMRFLRRIAGNGCVLLYHCELNVVRRFYSKWKMIVPKKGETEYYLDVAKSERIYKRVRFMFRLEVFLEKTLRSSFNFIKQVVREEKKVAFIIGPTIDSKIISLIRYLSCLSSVGVESLSFYNENKESIISMPQKSIKDIKGLIVTSMGVIMSMDERIKWGHTIDKSEYEFINNLEEEVKSSGIVSGNNNKSLSEKLEGGLLLQKEVLYIVPSYFSRYINELKKIAYGPSNLFLFASACIYNLSKFKAKKFLNLNSFSGNGVLKKNYNLSCSFSGGDVFIPVSTNLSDLRTYIDWRGRVKHTYVAYYNGVPMLSVLFYILAFINLDNKDIADHEILFNGAFYPIDDLSCLNDIKKVKGSIIYLVRTGDNLFPVNFYCIIGEDPISVKKIEGILRKDQFRNIELASKYYAQLLVTIQYQFIIRVSQVNKTFDKIESAFVGQPNKQENIFQTIYMLRTAKEFTAILSIDRAGTLATYPPGYKKEKEQWIVS